ncbi:MAG: outer membrane beta-barrel protein [Sulfurimonas sp.]|jgi:hypothetical protein|nr:outer membrane beta-barrel protein [Sulfurimonas sp.]
MKNKILLGLVTSSLLVAGLQAAKVGESGVGIEIGILKSDATSTVNGVSADGDISTTYQALRLGKYFDFGRLGATLAFVNEDGGTDGNYLALSYDYVFYNDGDFVPFVGAHMGYSRNEWSGRGISIDHNGFVYGLQAGLIYDFADEFEFEIGAKYSKTNVDGSASVPGYNISLDVENSMQYYMSVGYKF